MSNKVFITGLSATTACGMSANETWEAILAGSDGIDEIKNWDISSWQSKLGGEIKKYNPAKMLEDRKLLKVISKQDVLGLFAATQAVKDSKLLEYRETVEDFVKFNEETGIYVGSPGNKYFQQYDFLSLLDKSKGDMQIFAQELFQEVHPMWLLKTLPNNVLAYSAINFGFKGSNHNLTNHAAGGMQSIIEAYHAIKSGQAQRALVVAYDIATEPQALFYYQRLGVISSKHLKPFDYQHDGTILAEGSAALILESEESALKRHAKIYAEVLGGVSATEGGGLFSLDTQGAPLAVLLADILEKLELQTRDIGLITAHGNGNTRSDISEARAIQDIFGAFGVPVTSFKWSTGNTLCASGMIDTVLSVFALNEKLIPGIANFEHPSLECETLNVCKVHRDLINDKALVINRSFAGINSCLALKAYA